jgi:hypothetical protein
VDKKQDDSAPVEEISAVQEKNDGDMDKW